MPVVSFREFSRNPAVRASISQQNKGIILQEVKGDKYFLIIPLESASSSKLLWRGLGKKHRDEILPDTKELWASNSD